MRYFIALLCFISFPAFAVCPDPAPDDSICVSWQAPVQNVDGSSIPASGPGSIDSYRLFWSQTVGSFNIVDSVLINDPTLREFTAAGSVVVQRPAGGGDVDLFIVMTATNTESRESAYSNTVARVLNFPVPTPGGPTVLDVTIPLIISL